MKILHLISGLSTGGAEMMLYKLLLGMDSPDFKSEVICLTLMGPVAKKIKAMGVKVHSLGMRRGIPNPIAIFRIFQYLRRSRPDVLQTWMYHSDLIGGLAGKLAGNIGIVWGVRHGNLSLEGNKKTTLWTAKNCAWLSNLLPSKIICCSYASKEVHRRIGYKEDKMLVIPNGFDLAAFHPNKDARKKVRRTLGLSDEKILIGLVGRFDRQKDHKTFFQAARILHKDYAGAHFVLCGDGIRWNNPIIRKWINEAYVTAVTHLLGRRDDMASLYPALDIVSSSSYGEGFPNVLGEAMACGVPCVVTDVGDSARIVGKTGLVVPPRNAVALAGALKKMIELGEGRKKLGALARERIKDNYSLEKIVSQYKNVYMDVVTNIG
jgi:glycosyltransferase involved in cell wall biosynthesis